MSELPVVASEKLKPEKKKSKKKKKPTSDAYNALCARLDAFVASWMDQFKQPGEKDRGDDLKAAVKQMKFMLRQDSTTTRQWEDVFTTLTDYLDSKQIKQLERVAKAYIELRNYEVNSSDPIAPSSRLTLQAEGRMIESLKETLPLIIRFSSLREHPEGMTFTLRSFAFPVIAQFKDNSPSQLRNNYMIFVTFPPKHHGRPRLDADWNTINYDCSPKLTPSVAFTTFAQRNCRIVSSDIHCTTDFFRRHDYNTSRAKPETKTLVIYGGSDPNFVFPTFTVTADGKLENMEFYTFGDPKQAVSKKDALKSIQTYFLRQAFVQAKEESEEQPGS